jgi:hypothetical protein
MSASPASLRATRGPLCTALVAALLACLVLLPAVRSAGELHHAVAHVGLPETAVHGHGHGHGHAHGHGYGDGHGDVDGAGMAMEDSATDAESVLHALMHLPAAGADNPMLSHLGVASSLPSHAAIVHPGGSPPRSVSASPNLPFRPPIAG